MEYSISQLSHMAGVSGRTLRYYDEIGLLKPVYTRASGYRFYGEAEVDRLQQILFYREMGVELEQIRKLLDDPSFDKLKALEGHLITLHMQRDRIDRLIRNADHTIADMKGRVKMSHQDKFEGFKKELVEENEQKYGKEIHEKYGDKEVDKAYTKIMNLSEEEYEEWKTLEQEILTALRVACGKGDPAGEEAHKACELHRRWLTLCVSCYSKDYHRGLGQMYAADERFVAYYEQAAPGCAVFFKEAIEIFCEK